MREKLIDATCANERATSVFARPGIVLDQDVAVGEQPEQDELERVALADDRRSTSSRIRSASARDLVEVELRH